MRNVTERPEAVEYGTARLVGTDDSVIEETAEMVLSGKMDSKYSGGKKNEEPFGKGMASGKIIDALAGFLAAREKTLFEGPFSQRLD
jgi:UDP-N-acetylglucosamine 2-epimerase (non-hydrolysing)